MDVGQRLKKERLRLGKSQAEIAAEIGIAKKSQTNYELGHSAPAAAYLAAVAAVGIDVLYVLTGVPSPSIDAGEAELLRRYRAASPEIRAAVFGVLGVIASPAAPGGGAVAIHGGTQNQVIAGGQKVDTLTLHVGRQKKGGPK